MSKAFTREENDGPDIPEITRFGSGLTSGERNYLTPEGAERVRQELARLVENERPKLIAATDDPEARRQLFVMNHRIQQLEESLSAAEIVSPPTDGSDVVRFGARVTVREKDGTENTYRIVGVDEIDLEENWISSQSPLARALMNARAGEHVRLDLPAGAQEFQIVAVSYASPS